KLRGMHSPADESIQTALKLMNDETAGPVFIHCKRGADRTGAVVACYRISHDRWSTHKALEEANDFGMSWYQTALRSYVKGFGRERIITSIAATLIATPAQ